MKKSLNKRAAREVAWRMKRMPIIATVAAFSGIDCLQVASVLSKRIDGGRSEVFLGGEHVGYA